MAPNLRAACASACLGPITNANQRMLARLSLTIGQGLRPSFRGIVLGVIAPIGPTRATLNPKVALRDQ